VNRLAGCRGAEGLLSMQNQYSGKRDERRAVQQALKVVVGKPGLGRAIQARTLPMSVWARHRGRVCTTPTMSWAA
jgi:hypothetical protein